MKDSKEAKEERRNFIRATAVALAAADVASGGAMSWQTSEYWDVAKQIWEEKPEDC